MSRIVVDVRRQGESRRPRDEVWADIATIPDIARSIPAVRRCERNGDRWRWTFGRYGALGLEVVPAFDVDATFDPPDVARFWPVGEVSEGASGAGMLRLVPRGTRTAIDASVRVEVDVPIGALLAPALRRIIAAEIGRVLDGLLAELH